MKVQDYHFGIRTDVVQVGSCPEEGSPVYSEIYYVVAETEDGSRYAHFHAFREMEWIIDFDLEFGGYWDSTNSLPEAQKLLSRIENAEKINLDYWIPIEPVYGSQAYIRDDVESNTRLMELKNG